MKLIINAPINSLSFGNVSYNILRELWKNNADVSLFPIGDAVDISAFDKINKKYVDFLNFSTNKRLNDFSKDDFSLKLWHISGAENRISKKQALLTFHETSELTPTEKNILKNQDLIFVTSSFSKEVFEKNGIENVKFVPLGFDEDFHETGKIYFEDKIHFGLMGKFEHRKNTARIIKTWAKIFGNNPKYQLSCVVNNPFLNKNIIQSQIIECLEGKHYNNINFLPHLNTNSEVNEYLNAIDIDLGGLSGSEGWNLPSFNATCLGKWSVVLNATAHKNWANGLNSILIEPSKTKTSEDGFFFKKGLPFNQGDFFDISDEEMEHAILKSINYAKKTNENGKLLRQNFTYKNTTETILHELSKI